MKHPRCALGITVLIFAIPVPAQQAVSGRSGPPPQSPAARRPPATKSAQSYSAADIQAGESQFISQCGFCHGRDAQGGESGPDLTRSLLAAEDVRGDKLGPLILSGRPAEGMPAFSLPPADISALVAFIHDAKSRTESANGNRRSVDIEDLQTGNAEAGKKYFNGQGGCSKCHSLSGLFANVGSRFQGLALLQRMLYPRNRGPRTPSGLPLATVTAQGRTISGGLTYRDEFSITLIDSEGWSHSFALATIKLKLDDPLQAHADQLGKYSDEEMHNVFAFLQTLK